MVTIKDIAREAGVSYTTVSNVIHGKSSHVSPQTVEKINAIIRKSGYAPNMSARSLVNNSSKVVALVNQFAPNVGGGSFADPFQSVFISSMEERLRENGYYLMIRTVQDVANLVTFLKNWNIDGLFFMGLFKDEFFEALSQINIPVVLIDSYVRHPQMQNVGLEDYKGAYLATRYLLEHGHKNIAFVSPYFIKGGVIEQRFEGYRQALHEWNVPFQSHLVYKRNFDIASSIQLGKELAAQKEVTAIFATADIYAAGIMAGLRESGVNIPEEKSIIGFDDLNISQLVYPPLTTIHQDTATKGSIAVDLMIKKLQKQFIEQNEIILPVRLVERKSVIKI